MNVLDATISLIAPHYCVGCTSQGSLLCNDCYVNLLPAVRRCYNCLTANTTFATCQACRQQSPLRAVYAATRYQAAAKQLLWSLKFDRGRQAAAIIAKSLAATLPHVPDDVIVMPTATARSRVRLRGYDQAALIARQYAKYTQLPYKPLLIRTGSQEQIGAGRDQRRDQLRNAYSVRHPHEVAGKTIILVDDVVTTGATLETAAHALTQAGARAVHGLAFAQVS